MGEKEKWEEERGRRRKEEGEEEKWRRGRGIKGKG